MSLAGQTALVTGGTRGLGCAIGLRLARAGASVWLTHRWGSADEDAVKQRFVAAGAGEPNIVESDAGRAEDRDEVIDTIAQQQGRLDIIVSNVCVVGRGGSLERLDRRSLRRALDYSAWPLVGYVDRAQQTMGLPRVVIATSSDGVDHVYPDYDYVACSKAVLEALCRDLARQHGSAGLRANALRTRLVLTQGFEEIFGPELMGVLRAFPEYQIDAERVADAALALCGPGLSGLNGQVLRVDRGAGLVDNIAHSGPALIERLQHGPPTQAIEDEPLSSVEIVGDGPIAEALRSGLAEEGLDEAPNGQGVVAVLPSGDHRQAADLVWPLVQALLDSPRQAAVIVHPGGPTGALCRTLVQHLSAHLPNTRINAVHAGGSGTTARAALTLLGPLMTAVSGQHLDLSEAT